MSEPFLAEVKIVGFNFAPRGWAHCDGQILPINQNQSLYSLLGTTYGGDGRTSFALPDLRGRTPLHVGNGVLLGQKSGAENHTLTQAEIPSHTHGVRGTSSAASSSSGSGQLLATTGGGRRAILPYADVSPANSQALGNGQIGSIGGGAHNNMQPFLSINFVIALQGLFPSRN
ncbi:tail fiber protein [Aliiglaciecola sp. CAU 1673]|uniref:phage tail protein n=1 Tax=Aliiglaciecola sp. CAU 1673 TaxID=3032595 RepID=UPI0023DAE699|nr:tail fiber protein [Aliiglaciecola sp. CAU 1673]MDF2178066.1 tail fiber protein [Aliiglaciecola sp. CAU 1673]